VRKPFCTAEPNGPNIYRTVDEHEPTFIVDETTTLFTRKSDVHAIINSSNKRGFPIIRDGRPYNCFCPKIIGALGRSQCKIPRDTSSRSLRLAMLPAKPGEVDNDNPIVDDEEFAELRRKSLRWANDYGAAIVKIQPRYPADFNNRVKENWKTFLAIAEHAGEECASKARIAAEYISREAYEPSWGVRLLAVMDVMFQRRLSVAEDENQVHIFTSELMNRLNTHRSPRTPTGAVAIRASIVTSRS